MRPQTWRFPSRAECLGCHTAAGGHALSFNTRQLNRDQAFPGGTANLITALGSAGYLNGAPASPAGQPALARADDPAASLERRARSYLDANCSQCHQPGGPALGSWDARASTPLSLAGLINGPLIDNGGDPANRVIVPGDPEHSRLLQRISRRGAGQMPPLGSTERDSAGESLLRQWIAALAEPPPARIPGRLVNLAARAQVGANDQLIAGFAIGPGLPRRILVRAIGATLTSAFGVANALPDPSLTVFGPDSSVRIAATNDNWTGARPSPGAAELSSVFDSVGAFRLPVGSSDSALVAELAPGSYTAQVTGAGTASGVALVEIYDADSGTPAATTASRLVNLAVRARVAGGESVLIAGFSVSGGGDRSVLIRGIGPGLTAFGVSGALTQPALTLFSGSQSVAGNRGWNAALNAAEIRATAGRVGAFPLIEGNRDTALLVSVPPGSYALQVSGENASTGVALIEIYEVP